MLRHCCPVCGVGHDVTEARAAFAYGRQLACGPDCEGERRHRGRVLRGPIPAATPRPASGPAAPAPQRIATR
jgi:hypothetical protein